MQDRRQPMGEDQLASRNNDHWLPEEEGPMTNKKGPTAHTDFGWVIPVYCKIWVEPLLLSLGP